MKSTITEDSVIKLTSLNTAKSIIVVSGEFGTASAKLVFSDKSGDFVDVPDGGLTTGDVVELTHGLGNVPYVEVTGSNGATSIVINTYGA